MNKIDNETGTKEARIKLIRNELIGEYSWDTFDEADLKKMNGLRLRL